MTTDPGTAVRELAELADRWLGWFDGDQDGEPPFFPERRSEIADHLRQVRTVLAGLEEMAEDLCGHQHRQAWAEDVLEILLVREGGTVEITAAEQIRASRDGSFVSSTNPTTGGEIISYAAARPDGEAAS